MKVKEYISLYTQPHILWRWILLFVLFLILSVLAQIFIPNPEVGQLASGMFVGGYVSFFVLLPHLKDEVFQKKK